VRVKGNGMSFAANAGPGVFPMILGCDGVGTLDDGSRVIIDRVVGSKERKGDETLDPERHTFRNACKAASLTISGCRCEMPNG